MTISKNANGEFVVDVEALITSFVGSICPIGETHIDDPRFENFEFHEHLTTSLIDQLIDVYTLGSYHKEYSIQRASKRAKSILNDILETLNDGLDLEE
jgi:hypothetical protein